MFLKNIKLSFGTAALLYLLLAGTGNAQGKDNTNVPSDVNGSPDNTTHITITPLAQSRDTLTTETGSSTYVFNPQSISNLPQGDATSVNDLLLQAPGVAQDSYGQLHVRGDHADLQYRINGIILPEGITGFGQTLDTHFAEKIDLLTGALPAQYGYRTAGIVDITTKSGHFSDGGQSSVMVGGNNTFVDNQELYGSSGQVNYFFTGNFLQNDRGLEPPTASYHASHDDTTQDKEFGYLSYAINPETKFSVIVGNATNRFEIPDNPGQAANYTLAGTPMYNSLSVNERQFEHNIYAIGALQGRLNDNADYQLALFTRDSTVQFKPDDAGDLLFNGIASSVYQESLSGGMQGDVSWRANNTHTVRAGWQMSYEQATSNTNSLVFPADATGAQLAGADTPFGITDNAYKIAKLAGVYLQDEWHPFDKFTINYGLRADIYDAYVTEGALSPRIGIIYDMTTSTRLHAGYARYFTPPPTELIAPVNVSQFAGTTGQLPSIGASSVVPEKDNYFDMGVIQKVAPGLTLGVDAYYKQAHDLLDEGQFGQALIFAPFNYEKGWVRGIELTGDYNRGAFSVYSNLAIAKAMGKDVVSGQYNFTPDELAYIQSNAVHLDHDQLISGSAGTSYTYRTVKYGLDAIYGSGLRSGFANTDHLPFYATFNADVAHSFDLGKAGLLDGRVTVLNLFDKTYEIRDGSGIGVFAPQYGLRRTLFFMLTKNF